MAIAPCGSQRGLTMSTPLHSPRRDPPSKRRRVEGHAPDFRIEEGEDATMTSPLRERMTMAPTLLSKVGYLFFRNSEVC